MHDTAVLLVEAHSLWYTAVGEASTHSSIRAWYHMIIQQQYTELILRVYSRSVRAEQNRTSKKKKKRKSVSEVTHLVARTPCVYEDDPVLSKPSHNLINKRMAPSIHCCCHPCQG